MDYIAPFIWLAGFITLNAAIFAIIAAARNREQAGTVFMYVAVVSFVIALNLVFIALGIDLWV